jgi:coenzyme PQQ synthesis protein D (PqqD)
MSAQAGDGMLGRSVRPSPDVIAQRMGDECVIVHLRTNRIYDLNRTAARFWELLAAGHSLPQIHDKMLGEFAVDPLELEREIESILDFMRAQSLIEADEGAR